MNRARSLTAESVAFRRALHPLIDPPAVFDDWLAAQLLGLTREALEAEVPREQSPVRRALRAFLVARSRFAEEALAEAVARGARQYLLLGAGLDTFGYRSPFPELRVFEVDHQASQAFKQERLAAAGIAVPETVTHVAVDFEHEKLDDALRAAGFDPKQPTFVAWLGVVVYLSRPAIDETLRWIAGLAPKSGVVFDFSPDPRGLAPGSRTVFEALAARVAEKGEPWVTYLDPEPLEQELRGMGFNEVSIATGEALNARYFRGRTDHLRLAASSRIALARL